MRGSKTWLMELFQALPPRHSIAQADWMVALNLAKRSAIFRAIEMAVDDLCHRTYIFLVVLMLALREIFSKVRFVAGAKDVVA